MPSYTREDLLALAGTKSYERGIGYVSEVSGVTASKGTVRGVVSGTHDYLVELRVRRSGLDGDCDCPWGEEGNFCKHCVALGLVHLFDAEHGVDVPKTPDLRSYLESLDTGELVELVLEAADASPDLYRRLEMRAGLADGTGEEAEGIGTAWVDRALLIDDFLEYREARKYAETVQQVVAELENLLESGAAVQAEALARHAIVTLNGQAGMVDDSGGYVGGAAAELVEVHAEACEAACPDSVELAGWLLGLQVAGSGLPELSLGTYADALGEDGLASYRQRLFEDDFGTALSEWSVHFLKSEFARVAGDTDLLVQVYSGRDRVYYVGIVEALLKAGRAQEALDWALRGLRESEGNLDRRLVDHAARMLRQAGRVEELQALRWEAFERSPEVFAFRALRKETPEADWFSVREQALTLLTRSAGRRRTRNFPCSLVEVLLDEGNAEEAWAAAVEHGCDEDQWLGLAELRESSHPEDAIGVYVTRLRKKVQQVSPGLYPEAAELARKVLGLYERVGKADEGRGFVRELRAEHRRKRLFLAELDRVGLDG